MILQVQDVVKTFAHEGSGTPIEVLKGVNLEISKGETVAIVGQSGSGKSTLLSLLAALDHPSSGSIQLQSQLLTKMGESELARFRAKNIGIVFQQFHLMSHLTALENVSLPLELAHDAKSTQKANLALAKVGLAHRMRHFPYELSGGECQRAALARALVTEPAVLLADEPTGNLDSETGKYIADLLFELVKGIGMTMILVTHNEKLAQRCGRQLRLSEGRLN